jgi:hypothetical protein
MATGGDPVGAATVEPWQAVATTTTNEAIAALANRAAAMRRTVASHH